MGPICQAKIRVRTFEEREKMVAEATYVGTAMVTRGEAPNRQVVPIAVVYGESREEVRDRLMAKVKERGYDGFDVAD